ncbi:hypothetical protein C4J81_18590 (plasmid) [Deltaproteobacteria bacterium Smac51]|nr:hypothetical protein C4J81_18590 [Deltaproteobacteria bacterium Smac51]
MKKRRRIFIGLAEVGGGASALCTGFRRLGHVCDFYSLTEHPFKYGGQAHNLLIRLLQKTHLEWEKSFNLKRHWRRLFWKWVSKVLLAFFLCYCIVKYDDFIFYFGATFFRGGQDLPVLKFFRKKITFMYCGSDSRPPYLNGKNINLSAPEKVGELAEMTRQLKSKILWAEKYADHIIDSPPQALFHERRYISILSIGFASEINGAVSEIGTGVSSAHVKIIHSPSHQQSKGTCEIRRMIERLKKKYSIEYMEVVNQPNSVVKTLLSECDFVVDQLWSDTPMAGLAAEAAFFGKPAVVGGYYADFVNGENFPEGHLPPTVYVHPDRVEAAIEKLTADALYRLRLGAEAKRYVEANYKPEHTAGRVLQVIEGTFPPQWLLDPCDIDYLTGYGMAERDFKRMVKALVDWGGVQALGLADKPELEHAFMEIVNAA